MVGEDVNIKIGADGSPAEAEIKRIEAMIVSTFSKSIAMPNILGNVRKNIKTAFASGTTIDLGLGNRGIYDQIKSIKDMASQLPAVMEPIGAKFKQIGMDANMLPAVFKPIKKGLANVGQEATVMFRKMKKGFSTPPFAGWAMSIMFFGMAIKSIFDTIWRSSQKTFQEVAHSVEGTVTGFDMLNSSTAYLGYTLGAALEPIAMWLAPIIFMIAEWVSNNEKLVGIILVVVGVLGTLFLVIGTLKLAFDGFATAFMLMQPAVIGLWEVMTAWALGIGVSLWALIAIIGAILLALYLLWVTNFGGIKDFVVKTLQILWKAFEGIFKEIWGIFKNFIGLVTSIFKGDWRKAWEYFLEILKGVARLILKALVGLGALIVNVLIFAFNFIKDALFNILLKGFSFVFESIINLAIWLGGAIVKALLKPLEAVIWIINRVIAGINAIAGRTLIKPIKVDFATNIDATVAAMQASVTDFFTGLNTNVDAWRDAISLAYLEASVIEDAFENIDTLIPTTEVGDISTQPQASTTIINNNIQEVKLESTSGETGDDLLDKLNNSISRQRSIS
jgi:hypothetical protein